MVYLDTSALLKRYIPEANSEMFDAYFVVHAPFSISRLGLVEIRCALARKRRSKQITAEREKAAMNEIRTDIQDGILATYPVGDTHFAEALHLIDKMTKMPLRSLDALHLSIALSLDAHEIATADAVLRQAAQTLKMNVAYFGQ